MKGLSERSKIEQFFFTIKIEENRMIDDTQQHTAKRLQMKENLWIVKWKIVISQNSKTESCDREKNALFLIHQCFTII